MWVIINGEPMNTFLIKNISSVQSMDTESLIRLRDSELRYICSYRWANKLMKYVPTTNCMDIPYQFSIYKERIGIGKVLGYFFTFEHDGNIGYSELYDTEEEAKEKLDKFLEELNNIEAKVLKLTV